jgi:signal transduction histidine kinase
MSQVRIESGLLSIFRLFLALQLAIILINLHVHSVRGLLPVRHACIFVVAGIVLQFGYLSWPHLRERLGRFFLPIILVFSASFSVTVQKLFLNLPLSLTDRSSEEAAWQLFLYLFVPLILTGWQYGFRAVVGYCLFTTGLDFVLVRWVDPGYALFAEPYHRFVVIRFFSFVLAGFVVSRIMQQLRREREDLERANAKLARSVVTIEELTVSRERNRVARELHDTLAHTLSAMAIQLEGVNALWATDREKAHGMVQRCLQVTRDGLTETRRAISALRAGPLEDLGLVRALRGLAETAADRAGIRVDFDLPDDIAGLPLEVEQCFYRIGQEAIENVVRHTGARSMRVMLSGTDSELQMEIVDDGRGFVLSAVKGGPHFGLRGMRERAETIHAEFDIQAEAGKGAMVKVLWREAGP